MEIKRNNWSRFCRKFNADNQRRQVSLTVEHGGEKAIDANENHPFLGIAITKKGRIIDGIDLFVGQHDPDGLREPIASVGQLGKIVLEKDDHGKDNCLILESKDGTVARISLSGEKDPHRYHAYVQKVAYAVCQQRGGAHGRHFEDWLEAEKKIEEAELSLIS